MAFLNKAFFLVGLKSLNSGAGFLISFFVVIVLGANEATDALFVAMFFPIEMIRMVARRLPLILVPVFSESHRNADTDPEPYFLGWWLPLLLIGTILLICGAPVLVKLMAPGLTVAGHATAVNLLRILAPSFLLFGIFGHGMSIFYYHKMILFPEISLFAWRVTALLSLFIVGSLFGVYGYAVGVIVAGGIQFLVLYLKGRARGWALLSMKKPDFQWPYLKLILTGSALVVVALVLNRTTALIDRWFASLLGAGSISILFFSERLARSVPMLLSTSIFTVYLPKLSSITTQADKMDALRQEMFSFFMILGLPIAVLFFWSAADLVHILAAHGRFTGTQTVSAAAAIQYFCLGIPAVICSAGLRNVFIVERNIREVFLFGMLTVTLTLVLDFTLLDMGLKGLALASTLTAWMIFFVLWIRLKMRVPPGRYLITILASSSLLLLFLFGLPWNRWEILPVIRLCVGWTGGLFLYGITIMPVAGQIRTHISN
jgi:peptidoglycan biosynthesis protein MviN/MurJ (putative lipid II flippase)